MSHYDEVLEEARSKATSSAKEYIPKLYDILTQEEHKTAEDARKIIEHDLLEYWSKATVTKWLPQETKDEQKVKAGKAGKQAQTLVLAEGQSVTMEADSGDSVNPNGNDDEEAKDTEIAYWKEKATELEDAMHKISDKQFVQATQLEPTKEEPLTDEICFQWLRNRAQQTGDIIIVDRVGSGALVQALAQYKNSFGVAELFLRIIKK